MLFLLDTAQYSGSAARGGLGFSILLLVAWWRMFEKAGEPGWKAIIPFYNTYIAFQKLWGNGWYFLLLLVPAVNAVVILMTLYKLSRAFGHGWGYFWGLFFLSPIFMLILGFNSDVYLGVPGRDC